MSLHLRKTLGLSAFLILLAATFAGSSIAGEVAEGTVLSKDNLAALENDTFQGIKVGDLLTDSQKMWIMDYKLKMKLGKTTELKLDPAYLEATRKYAGQAKLDAGTKTVSNYTAGIPFQNVEVSDPDAGYKLAWNQYYANPVMGDNWIATGDVTIVDGDKGTIDRFEAISAKMIMEGRTTGGPNRLGNEEDHARYLLTLSKPYDLAGLGIYTKQYSSGKLDDAWVYVKSIRRTRRVAGGKSWMDPQPKMDLLNDDNQGVNAYPLWYQSWKLLGKRWILAVVTGPSPKDKHNYNDYVEQAPPFWNQTNVTWEPREVYVVEAIPPAEHPYSKKILYMDAEYPFFYQSDLYDRKGAFWRLWRETYSPTTSVDGQPGLAFFCTQAIDFQRNRATYIDIISTNLNSPDFNDRAFSPDMLQAAGQGGLDKFLK
ncbi:MAG: DUF1329 domain-containing protein [Desulfuromonadales bacterium]|nr:DUF1329 domain-containing protein [Desulfuromonadales bacterium]